jgi:hypothetical protein
MSTRPRPLAPLAALLLLLGGCVNANDIANRVGRPPENAAQLREAETRRFETDEATLLSEATQVLQDLGFNINESTSAAGVLVATKSRDAHEAGQIAAQIALTVVAAAFLVAYVPNWDTAQTIQVTVVTNPDAQTRQTAMRASFERIVLMSQGGRRHERLTDPKMYEEFFNGMGRGIALGASRT